MKIYYPSRYSNIGLLIMAAIVIVAKISKPNTMAMLLCFIFFAWVAMTVQVTVMRRRYARRRKMKMKINSIRFEKGMFTTSDPELQEILSAMATKNPAGPQGDQSS
jgi:hypothetical protein